MAKRLIAHVRIVGQCSGKVQGHCLLVWLPLSVRCKCLCCASVKLVTVCATSNTPREIHWMSDVIIIHKSTRCLCLLQFCCLLGLDGSSFPTHQVVKSYVVVHVCLIHSLCCLLSLPKPRPLTPTPIPTLVPTYFSYTQHVFDITNSVAWCR